MWFLFGFITILLFCALSVWMRVQARWSGAVASTGCHSFLRNISTYKGKTTAARLGIDAPQHLSFVFKRESRVDRIFKGIGLSSEHQVGTSRFDDAVYIVSDDEQLWRTLTNDPSVQALVLDIFNTGSARCKAKSIRCHGGRLWIEYQTSGKAEELDLGPIESAVIPRLHKMVPALSAIPRKAGRRWNDPFTLKAIAILSLSTGLALNFAVQMLRIYAEADIPFTVDSWKLWRMSAVVAVAGAILFCAVVAVFLGGSARAHLVLIEVLLVGTIGVGGSAYVELRDLNMEWDSGAVVRHQARVVGKMTRKSRRSVRRYLVVEDWNKRNATYEIKVSRADYDGVFQGERLSVDERPGYLAVPWVAGIKKANGAALE